MEIIIVFFSALRCRIFGTLQNGTFFRHFGAGIFVMTQQDNISTLVLQFLWHILFFFPAVSRQNSGILRNRTFFRQLQ